MASSLKVSPANFAAAVNKLLDEYGRQVYDVMDDAVETVSKEAQAKLRAVKTFNPDRKPTGAYSRSWTYRKDQDARIRVTGHVYNAKHYRLTHLLENGHVCRNGTGRTFDPVRPYEHIGPVNDWAEGAFEKELRREIERI